MTNQTNNQSGKTCRNIIFGISGVLLLLMFVIVLFIFRDQSCRSNSTTLPRIICPRRAFNSLDETIESFKSGEKLIIAFSKEAAPYSFANSANPEGLEVKLIQKAIERIEADYNVDISIEWLSVSTIERMSSVTPSEGTTRADIVIGAVSRTNDRCVNNQTICTTNSHMRDRVALLLPKNAPQQSFADLSEFCLYFHDLTEIIIGALSNTTGPGAIFSECEQIIPDFKPRVEYIPGGRTAVMTKVNSSDVDQIYVYVTDERILHYYASFFKNTSWVSLPFRSTEDYVFAFAKGSEGLRDLVDEAMNKMSCDTTFAAEIQSWEKLYQITDTLDPDTIFPCTSSFP